ncbi:hypothetical protein F5888DRAFT_1669362, partial [Russula emetica]
MSFIETSLQTSYPDEFSDTVAKMTASILQEQLAPIVDTLREHARLLDLHAALLNHSTAMNRYNVGKIDDIRDFQNNINFKLQFYVDPEDRWHPNYRNSRTPSTSTSTETLPNTESRLPAADAHTQADEPTHSTAASSSPVAASPGLPSHPSTPAATEHADSRPTTPRQELGDGFSVVPGPSRRLQRERPFSVAPDPMWNSSREIQPYEHLATYAPPPPYIQPPTYAEVVPPEQIEAVEEVVYSDPFAVEIIEIEPSTLQSPTLDIRDVSVSSSAIPRVPVTEEEAHNNPSYSYGPSWTFESRRQAPNSTASEDVADEDPQVTTSTDDAHNGPSHPPDQTILWAEMAENSTTSENETGDVDVGSGDENPNAEPQLSEKARGKKRMREEDYSSDEKDDSEMLEGLLGGGCSSGSGSNTSSDRDGQPDRKRMKMDTDTDTRISTDRLEVDGSVSMVARMGLFETLTNPESFRQVKKLKEIEKLYRRGRLSL